MARARGELERDVMAVLWARDESLSARAVQAALSDATLAHSTVRTVLERLYRKQVLARVEIGRAWHYAPARSREGYVAELMLAALDRTGDRDAALVRFARAVTDADAEVLRDALDRSRPGTGDPS